MLSRQPKGYGQLGVVWSRTPAGTTVIFGVGRFRLAFSRRDRDFERQLVAAAERARQERSLAA